MSMGANGVGKSTLLHSIMGRPDLNVDGDISFMGSDITDLEVDPKSKTWFICCFPIITSIPGLSNFQMLKQALNPKGSEIAIYIN